MPGSKVSLRQSLFHVGDKTGALTIGKHMQGSKVSLRQPLFHVGDKTGVLTIGNHMQGSTVSLRQPLFHVGGRRDILTSEEHHGGQHGVYKQASKQASKQNRYVIQAVTRVDSPSEKNMPGCMVSLNRGGLMYGAATQRTTNTISFGQAQSITSSWSDAWYNG